MPTRRNLAAPSGVTRPAQPRKGRVNTDSILMRRSRLVAEVAELREGGASPLTDNAQQLLTRWWSSAGWRAREQLLRTTQWLIQLERNRRSSVQAPV
jgi:hypothetical protein